MANKFEKRTYTNRQSQYPGRRKFTPTGIENVYEVERQEGEITDPGTAFDADTLNDIEQRVYNGFNLLDDTDISITDTDNIFTGTKLNEVLRELFQYASNGKTAIANAIRGVSSSSTFAVLANAITTGKTAITTAIGTGTANNTFTDIAGFINTIKSNLATAIGGIATNSSFSTSISTITSGKTAIANAIGQTPGGTPTVNSTFAQMANLISTHKKTCIVGSFTSQRVKASNQIISYRVNYNFGFTPSDVVVKDMYLFLSASGGEDVYEGFVLSISKRDRPTSPYDYVTVGVDKITNTGFDIWIMAYSTNNITIASLGPLTPSAYTFIAIG